MKMEICQPKKLDRSQKIKKIYWFSGASGPFRTPEWIPKGVRILFYHSVRLPPHKIIVKIMNICRLSELDGRKFKKFKILVNFSYLRSFGPPCWAPRGLHSRFLFSTNLSTLDPCNNNKNVLPE